MVEKRIARSLWKIMEINMAAVVQTADMTIEKNSKILVNVEEALADLLVVSYYNNNQKFQGVLLDSSKSNLPFGVYSLHPAFTKRDETTDGKDTLHSVSQRFLYQESDYTGENGDVQKKPPSKGKAPVRQKMTVRLRPRKVLCSNCKGICNENNENVDVSKKRKIENDETQPSEPPKSQNKYLKGSMLIPKLSRLEPSEITSAVKSKSSKTSEKQSKQNKPDDGQKNTQEVAFVSVSDGDIQDPKQDNEVSFSSMFSNAKTLKICFGAGEGTVVKIPPLAGDFNEDSGVSCDMAKPDSKAAKKALRKAKKQAKKGSEKSQSPKHMGALSPRNSVANSPSMTENLDKKHKHRVKHKKKYKTQKGDENTSKSNNSDDIDYFSNIKDHCMNQKLSINLRRLSSNCYEKCENEVTESGSEEWESETVPDFPLTATEGVGSTLFRISPGDIVWGKVVGFPWWPGRVLSVTSTSRAHVAWFASTTSSLIPFDSLSPFLEDYKLRFNKKKRGAYKEAVKQATLEAKRNESQISDPLASPTNLAALSPRPIDVFS